MEPLANKIRPKNLDEYIGQTHLVGENAPVKEAMKKKHLFSFILWGPPGVGKTTLARIYASSLNAKLFELSAVSAGKSDIKSIISKKEDKQKILFLDEIHRFNKAQQDFLLPFIENGELFLIGATTENPGFEVISALLSRCRVFTLKELTDEDINKILLRANTKLNKETSNWIAKRANGDARQALAILENTQQLYGEITIKNLENSLQDKTLRYDKHAEEHHNTISAYIKSMRAGQADAAIYYLARMLSAGEDPKYIARRMVIFASEDIGLAQPTALVVANEVFRTCETMGLPECRINLAHGTAYLSQAKKDRSAYNALNSAVKDVKKYGNLSIPFFIRNAVTKTSKDAGYGKNYEMYPKDKNFLPDELKNRKYLK